MQSANSPLSNDMRAWYFECLTGLPAIDGQGLDAVSGLMVLSSRRHARTVQVDVGTRTV